MKFFQPKDNFIPAIKPFLKGKTVIDCGCGEGHVTELFNIHGIPATGVDLYYNDANIGKKNLVIGMDAIQLLRENVVPFIARPCAGEWYFNIIQKALTHFNSYAILVQKSANYKRDIRRLRRSFNVKLIKRFVGKERESLYLITKKGKFDMKLIETDEELTFRLVQTPYWDSPWWVEDCGTYWGNMSGGRCPKSDNDKILETVVTKNDFESLDWTKTGMVDNSNVGGWLSPEGKFYGVSYMQHDTVARCYLKKDPDELMNAGWVRIHEKDDWLKFGDLTQQQLDFMFDNGYATNKDDANKFINDPDSIYEGEDQL